MMDKILTKITDYWIKYDIIKNDDKDIYIYGLDLMISTVLNIAAVLLTSLVIGNFNQTLLLMCVLIPLQSLGGGYHAETHFRCFCIMYIGWWVVMPLIKYVTPFMSLAMIVISLCSIFLLAPVPHPNVPMSNGHRNKLKKILRFLSILIALLGIFFTFAFLDNYYGYTIAVAMMVLAVSMLAAYFKKECVFLDKNKGL